MEFRTGQQRTARGYALMLALITWSALVLQFYFRGGQTIAGYFSFFTILSNLLVALSLTISAVAANTAAGRFFSRLSVQSAIGLYIFIVCLVYNLVLRGIVVLTGWRAFVDNMLHVVVPVLYLLYWTLFRMKGRLNWRDSLQWLLFPFLYLVYSLIRGAMVHWYPYPFLNVDRLGYNKVLLNAGIMLVVFLVAGFALIYLTQLTKNKSGRQA